MQSGSQSTGEHLQVPNECLLGSTCIQPSDLGPFLWSVYRVPHSAVSAAGTVLTTQETQIQIRVSEKTVVMIVATA